MPIITDTGTHSAQCSNRNPFVKLHDCNFSWLWIPVILNESLGSFTQGPLNSWYAVIPKYTGKRQWEKKTSVFLSSKIWFSWLFSTFFAHTTKSKCRETNKKTGTHLDDECYPHKHLQLCLGHDLVLSFLAGILCECGRFFSSQQSCELPENYSNWGEVSGGSKQWMWWKRNETRVLNKWGTGPSPVITRSMNGW